ncbi:hypothetical protein [Rhodococcus sp. NBC_00294]|uniref:hypothetical protein n=1 Tax=Rhodococcus sp. NBC_00294 TaxID=2976004 RepID=UPI002E2A84D4|nr:hypothetical protein [Rhodococcus sp. NBC_00294]
MEKVTARTLGAWVITVNPRKTDVASLLADGHAGGDWCVAPNYRSRLMAAGQPILLWVSNRSGVHPARGFWGVGTVLGPAVDMHDPDDPRLHVPTEITTLGEPVTAAECAGTAGLDRLEMLRSPQQSNPSVVTASEWSLLRARLERAPEAPGLL